ncbi:hypothetical protein LCGC14_2222600 [marine sediment metagenome]|uniref:DNA polymerase III subunit chi n=1 Tax=marine sediment metagenome TaxID=412755 RepID=A0A0F9DAL6_9ZZZZ
MGAVYFYHLTERPLEATLPLLLDRARQAGWRVVVRGANPRRLEALDEALWTGSDDSFLPHGIAGGAHDADQPILLSTGTDLPNGAQCVMCIEGAEIAPAEIETLDRACVLFDGGDPVALDRARGQWRALTRAGVKAQYWSEEGGRWEKKAES